MAVFSVSFFITLGLTQAAQVDLEGPAILEVEEVLLLAEVAAIQDLLSSEEGEVNLVILRVEEVSLVTQ